MKMRMKYLLLVISIFSVLIFGCTQAEINSMKKEDVIMEKGTVARPDGTMIKEDASISKSEQDAMANEGYVGQILAGNGATKYLDFNKDDYEKALKEKKKILLYFYSNWCPTCKKEQPETFAAFNELNDRDLIGFRVNFRDSDTDADEEQLAKDFGVSYQHTKVILKDGQRVLKAPDSWDKQRYMDELNKA